jgi:transposase-like protein
LQARRDGKAGKRFFRRLLKRHRDEPRLIVTDKLRNYGVALRELIPNAIHARGGMQTIGRSFHIRRPEYGNEECVVSNRGSKRSDFAMCMQPSTIFSIFAAI